MEEADLDMPEFILDSYAKILSEGTPQEQVKMIAEIARQAAEFEVIKNEPLTPGARSMDELPEMFNKGTPEKAVDPFFENLWHQFEITLHPPTGAGVQPGYVFAHDSSAPRLFKEHMPTLGGTALDATTPPKFTVGGTETIWVKATWTYPSTSDTFLYSMGLDSVVVEKHTTASPPSDSATVTYKKIADVKLATGQVVVEKVYHRGPIELSYPYTPGGPGDGSGSGSGSGTGSGFGP